ncbi:hypothetical protein THAOC_19511 [Thalassiosira oceanica]|uniref:Uncharacterized protein n=1 Tax=Thalassiosira oceanica TaxID=159749 RepID=K0SGU5_THAOC|nr:hypothetical protein THAOC_19511 [Thalassiosira oceanica]|eukprot:EJK60186.1 hypothetical protein THAOC_19511 [Thalassiosira oceanica]
MDIEGIRLHQCEGLHQSLDSGGLCQCLWVYCTPLSQGDSMPVVGLGSTAGTHHQEVYSRPREARFDAAGGLPARPLRHIGGDPAATFQSGGPVGLSSSS